jgi:hypothetical protein
MMGDFDESEELLHSEKNYEIETMAMFLCLEFSYPMARIGTGSD